MKVETLGVARSLGWKVHVRCAHAALRLSQAARPRHVGLYTRGPNFPLSRLELRLMYPACGSRNVTVVFEPPSNAQVGGG
jgi:hypothetical protein